jgi:GTP cyclohydrolase II
MKAKKTKKKLKRKEAEARSMAKYDQILKSVSVTNPDLIESDTEKEINQIREGILDEILEPIDILTEAENEQLSVRVK